MYYLSIYLLIVLLYFIQNKGSKYSSIWFLFLVIFLTSGCRYEVGTDYFSYKELYEMIYPLDEAIKYREISIDRKAEFGYMFLSSIFRCFNVDINIMYLFLSFFTTLLIFKSILKYSAKYFFLSFLTYYTFVYFVVDLSAVRQCISISIFVYSIQFILKKQCFKYLMLISIASLFHTSSLFLFPFYWLLQLKYTNRTIYAIILFSFLICLFKVRFISYGVENISTYIGGGIIYKLFIYTLDSQKEWGMNLKVILQILILFVLLRNRNFLILRNEKFNIFINLFFYYLLIRLLLWESIDLNSRLGYYFILGLVLCLPYLLECSFNKFTKRCCLILILLFNFYQGHTYFLEKVSTITYNPYQNYFIHNILNKKDTGEERWRIHKNVNEE